jgi:hypothetical protein
MKTHRSGPYTGLQGPYTFINGRELYWDVKADAWYDHRTDLYVDSAEIELLNQLLLDRLVA